MATNEKKTLKFEVTADEARTLLWALSVMHAKECRRLSKKGIKPSEHRTTKNLSAVSRIVNSALVDAEQ